MMGKKQSGHREIKHTGDASLQVWSSTLEGLFLEAAQGMYGLLGIKFHQNHEDTEKIISLAAIDLESLLVTFLSELLYLVVVERFAFRRIDMRFQEYHLQASLQGGEIAEQFHEIKAVTYHRMVIHNTDSGFSVSIVFDI